jgi:hypothetical protein
MNKSMNNRKFQHNAAWKVALTRDESNYPLKVQGGQA